MDKEKERVERREKVRKGQKLEVGSEYGMEGKKVQTDRHKDNLHYQT